MEELHGAVQRLQAVGLEFGDVKSAIAAVVTAQRSNREALAALKQSAARADASAAARPGAQQRWVALPSGVWLRLPADQAEWLLRSEAQELAGRLEALFAQQKRVLAQLEEEGLGPEHFSSSGGHGS